MSTLARAWERRNLERAWGWLRSNPDRNYKSYFRDTYGAYASADGKLLDHLADRLMRGIYVPSDACKIFLPKPSGILRPISLLTVEDQIVYQALANIVAENLSRIVSRRYNRYVFGHQYAGRKSPWFYRKWSDGYRAFNLAATKAHARGFRWTASFDLTAFYDSIDHGVLRHFLSRLGCESQLAQALTDFLSKWTATRTQIYHNHGIPQGPLSSGLISETVLSYFDQRLETKARVIYLRYVDDIRLFARDARTLRSALVTLDLLSKDIGLFPQSSKIDIHEVMNIQGELKSIDASNYAPPPRTQVSDKALFRELVRLSPRYKVTNPTRFKWLLGGATPNFRLTERLWRIYENQPHFYDAISRYLSRYPIMPKGVASRLVREVAQQELYPAIQAAFVTASIGRLHPDSAKRATSVLKPLWKPRTAQADLSDALGRWLLAYSRFTLSQAEYAVNSTKPAWLRSRVQFAVPWRQVSKSQTAAWLNANLRSASADVAIGAARLVSILQVDILKPHRAINPLAKCVLAEYGRIRRASTGVCGIRLSIKEMTGQDVAVNWRKLFGRHYKNAEAQVVDCKSHFRTSANAWVNATDVFVDWLFSALFQRDPQLGTYTHGTHGGMLTHKRLRAKYPAVLELAKQVHSKRYISNLSHARTKNTGKPTQRIPFPWLRTGAALLLKAARELSRSFPAQ